MTVVGYWIFFFWDVAFSIRVSILEWWTKRIETTVDEQIEIVLSRVDAQRTAALLRWMRCTSNERSSVIVSGNRMHAGYK